MNPLLLLQLLGPLLSNLAKPAPAEQAGSPPAGTTPAGIDPAVLAAILAASHPPPEPVLQPQPLPGVVSVLAVGLPAATLIAMISMAVVIAVGGSVGEQQMALLIALSICIGALIVLSATAVNFLLGSSLGSWTKNFRPVAPPPVALPPVQPPSEPVVIPPPTPTTPVQPATGPLLTIRGRCSYFGGPDDPESKMTPDLAFWNQTQAAKRSDLFLSIGPGLFARLNPQAYYIACRWNYKQTPASYLRSIKVKVTNPQTGKVVEATPVDWGPHERTGRVADLSPGIMSALKLKTDDEVKVEVPLPGAAAQTPVDAPGGPAWLATAVALRGLYEHSGSTDNPAILEMARICGGNIAKTYKHDSIPWCALFANYCLIASGHSGTDSLLALDFADYSKRLSGPAVGAIACKKRDGGGHVFFVRGRDEQGRLVGIGGNQSDMVCDEEFDAEAIVAYTWPDDAPLPAKVGASMTDVSVLPKVTAVPRTRRDVELVS